MGWAIAAWQLLASFSPEARSFAAGKGIPSWLMPFNTVTAALSVVSLFGMWRMRRVGVLGFILVAGLQNATMLWLHGWGTDVILFPVVATLIGLGFLPRMR